MISVVEKLIPCFLWDQNISPPPLLREGRTPKIKNAIPNLLNKVMFAIPSGVQITSIENTSERHVVINAQSERYEQLGVFIGTIKQTGILTNVTSDSGTKQDSLVRVTIEGELP